MSGKFRIGAAVVLGVALVAIAFVARPTTEDASTIITAVKAPPRNYIPTEDANEDGIADWREELLGSNIRPIPEIKLDETASSTYTPPETLTGQFAESFIEDYLSAKTQGASKDESQSVVINNAIKSLEYEKTDPTPVKLNEIKTTGVSSEDLRTYGNAVGSVITRNIVSNESELRIWERAVKNNDVAMLAELDPIIAAYERMFNETKNIPAPESLTGKHIDLLNGYQLVQRDVAAMKEVFDDPLYAVVYAQTYVDDVQKLQTALQGIMLELQRNDIIFTKEEPGQHLEQFAP